MITWPAYYNQVIPAYRTNGRTSMATIDFSPNMCNRGLTEILNVFRFVFTRFEDVDFTPCSPQHLMKIQISWPRSWAHCKQARCGYHHPWLRTGTLPYCDLIALEILCILHRFLTEILSVFWFVLKTLRFLYSSKAATPATLSSPRFSSMLWSGIDVYCEHAMTPKLLMSEPIDTHTAISTPSLKVWSGRHGSRVLRFLSAPPSEDRGGNIKVAGQWWDQFPALQDYLNALCAAAESHVNCIKVAG